MHKIRICSGAVAATLLALCPPVAAHHSFAMFDQTRVTEMKGVTVLQFQWSNPHAFMVIKSNQTTYTLECGSPSNMTKAGWKFTSVKPGEKIDISFYPLRNGKPGGALKGATLPNGTTLSAW